MPCQNLTRLSWLLCISVLKRDSNCLARELRMSLLLLNGTTNLSTFGLSNDKISIEVGSWRAVSISILILAVISFASVLGLREETRDAISNPDAHTFTESAVILAAQDEWGACSRSRERDTGFDFLVPVSPCPLPYTCSVCTNTLFTCANRLCEIALAYVCCQL